MARKAYAFSSWFFAIVALFLGILHAVLGSTPTEPLAISILALFVAGYLSGIVAHRPATPVALLSLITIGLISGARYFETRSEQPLSDIQIESIFLCAQMILIVWLSLAMRQRSASESRNVAIDGLIVAMGAWVLVWVSLIQPAVMIDASDVSVVRAASVGAGVIVLFLLVTYFFSRASEFSGSSILGLAVVFELTGVVLRNVDARSDVSLASATIDAPFLIALGLCGAAFLHPGIRQLPRHTPARISQPLMTRLIVTTASLIVPVIVLALTDPSDTSDRSIRATSVVILAVVVMLRVVQSVRDNARTQTTLVRNALTDSLTGLPNRVLMIEHIETALDRSWRTSHLPSVLFIDVDRFKNINDSLGHSIGDQVLTELSSRLLEALPPTATIGRIAGDEFVVLDSHTESPTQSVLLAESLLDTLRQPISSPEGDMFVTASIGVAYAPKGLRLGQKI